MGCELPVRIWPSAWRMILDLRLLRTRTWWVSAMPSSQGRPALLMPVQELAPVPPSWPETTMCSALPLATPEATTPTPTYKIRVFYFALITVFNGHENREQAILPAVIITPTRINLKYLYWIFFFFENKKMSVKKLRSFKILDFIR